MVTAARSSAHQPSKLTWDYCLGREFRKWELGFVSMGNDLVCGQDQLAIVTLNQKADRDSTVWKWGLFDLDLWACLVWVRGVPPSHSFESPP